MSEWVVRIVSGWLGQWVSESVSDRVVKIVSGWMGE